jgi:4-amino-4-deoxy-L-arabinose transferase-like glycosyltransferase
MKIFGGAEWVLSLYSLLCSLGGVVLAFLLGTKIWTARHGLLAALLLALLPLDVSYATPRPYLSHIFAGLAVGMAYLAKETGVIMGVPIPLLFLYRRRFDCRR